MRHTDRERNELLGSAGLVVADEDDRAPACSLGDDDARIGWLAVSNVVLMAGMVALLEWRRGKPASPSVSWTVVGLVAVSAAAAHVVAFIVTR